MRVCFVSRRYWPAISGISVYAENLLRELVAAGHEVTMVSQYRGDRAGTRVYGGGPPPDVDRVRVVGREALGEQDGGDFERDLDDLVAQVQALGPFDVVHAQDGYPTGLAALEAARRAGVPCVVSIQGGDGHWVGDCCATHRDAMRIVIEEANAVILGSASFRDEVVTRLDVAADRFTIVPGAVDTARFTSHEPVGGRRLLYHGRVDRRKGILDLLEALRIARGFELTVSGIGPDMDAAMLLGEDLGVRFVGVVPYAEVPGVFREQDVFVSPTYAEGFSNTVLEAMASGLPIVAGRAVGVVDCLEHERNALLVEPGDVEGIAAALERMAEDSELRARLRAAALEDVAEQYAWTRVGGLIDETYRRVEGSTPGPGWEIPRERLPCKYRDAPHLL